jgi:hypothetical protein
MVTDMLQRTIARQTDRKVDQLALLALLWDLENFSLYLANQNYDEGECRKVERIMEGLCCAVALGQAGEGVLLREADKG